MLMHSTLQFYVIQLKDACKHESQMIHVSIMTCMQQQRLSGMTLPLISAFLFVGGRQTHLDL